MPTSPPPYLNIGIQNQNQVAEEELSVTEKLTEMALVPSPNEGPLFAEVDMGADASAIRATVVQASTVFYDTPATLGYFPFCCFFPICVSCCCLYLFN